MYIFCDCVIIYAIHLLSLLNVFFNKECMSLVLYVCYVDRCFSFCPFFFWPLCCLFFFDLRIPITPLISGNSSHRKYSLSLLTMYVWRTSSNDAVFNFIIIDFKYTC